MTAEFETVARRWGNSLGVTIPKDVAERLGVTPGTKVRVGVHPSSSLREVFGTVRFRKSTVRMMREIDRELWGIKR